MGTSFSSSEENIPILVFKPAYVTFAHRRSESKVGFSYGNKVSVFESKLIYKTFGFVKSFNFEQLKFVGVIMDKYLSLITNDGQIITFIGVSSSKRKLITNMFNKTVSTSRNRSI